MTNTAQEWAYEFGGDRASPQILAKLVKKRAAHLRRIEELYQPPIDKLTRGKVRILGLQRQRLDREIHMHERELGRLRGQGEGA